MRISLLLLLLSIVTISARADIDGEREALARLAHELVLLEPMIAEAQAHADYPARIRFRYDWLRQDLSRIRLAIQEHINAPPPVPRSVAPLRGDYRR